MAERALSFMNPEEFFAWQEKQEERYELVDGLPFLHLDMMAGARGRHDQITVNTIIQLGNQLGDGPCRVKTADTAIKIPKGNRRRGDVTVECGALIEDSFEANQPTLVVEVLSQSTRRLDRFRKLEEYKSIMTLEYIILIDPEIVDVMFYYRDVERGWANKPFLKLDDMIELAKIRVTLRLKDLYRGLALTSSTTPEDFA